MFCIFVQNHASEFPHFIIILVEILLLELKLKFVAFCHTHIGPFLSKNGQNDAIFVIILCYFLFVSPVVSWILYFILYLLELFDNVFSLILIS